MDRIARASTDERRLVFEAAAQRMALAPAVVEKDFWMCYTLDHLFHRSGFAESMVFKGGTSLSKAFGLIERFSEDIDLILDWRLLGYGENEPWEPRSNSAQERFKTDSIERTNAFLAAAFVPKLGPRSPSPSAPKRPSGAGPRRRLCTSTTRAPTSQRARSTPSSWR